MSNLLRFKLEHETRARVANEALRKLTFRVGVELIFRDERLERDVQRVNEACRLVCKSHFAVQLLPERFYHSRAEASAGWLFNVSARLLRPREIEPAGRVICHPD